MKIFSSQKKSSRKNPPAFLLVALFFIVLIGFSLAYAVGYKVDPQTTKEIDIYNICKKVTNQSVTNIYFIPTETEEEWSKFREHFPNDVKIEGCFYVWEAEAWSNCSKNCGGGVQIRNAWCKTSEKIIVADNFCKEKKPILTQSCYTQDCVVASTPKPASKPAPAPVPKPAPKVVTVVKTVVKAVVTKVVTTVKAVVSKVRGR